MRLLASNIHRIFASTIVVLLCVSRPALSQMKPEMMTQKEAYHKSYMTELRNVHVGASSFIRAIKQTNSSKMPRKIFKDLGTRFHTLHIKANHPSVDIEGQKVRDEISYLYDTMNEILHLDGPGRKHRKHGYRTTAKDYVRSRLLSSEVKSNEMKKRVMMKLRKEFDWEKDL